MSDFVKLILCLIVSYFILSLLLIIIDISRGKLILNIVDPDGSDVMSGIKYVKALIIGFISIWFSYLYVKLFVNSEE